MTMLTGRRGIVFGAGGAMGGAVATAFAAEGAHVCLAGRSPGPLADVARRIVDAGGSASTAAVDARDPQAVEACVAAFADDVGGVDIAFNAVGMDAIQGIPLVDMTAEDFLTPIVQAAQTQFATATAVARRMTAQGSGVILLLSSTGAREWRHRTGGFGPACALIESFARGLAAEVGPQGVRVVCLRPNFTPETAPGAPPPEVVAPLVTDTALHRLPTLAEVAGTAVFAASDAAGAITGTILNLSCGAIPD